MSLMGSFAGFYHTRPPHPNSNLYYKRPASRARLLKTREAAVMPAGKVRRRGGNLHHAVAEDIGARILRGEFAPGTLLPNEAEWCQAYKVSRTAVREAIRMLAAKGLVASRPKIGSRVEPRERWNLLDRDVLSWYGSVPDRKRFLVSVQQMRYIFEPEAAALAAENRTPEQLAQIETACREMGEASSLQSRTKADVRFHLAILRA